EGKTPPASVAVTHPNASGLTRTPANGSGLGPEDARLCPATHAIAQADIDAGSYYNQACVDDGADGAAPACDQVTTPGTKKPHLEIGRASCRDGYSSTGDAIHYTNVDNNEGNTTRASVTINTP